MPANGSVSPQTPTSPPPGLVRRTLPTLPPRPAAGSLNPGTCRLVSYRGRELWRWPLHDHPLSIYRQATAPKLDGDATRPTGTTSYFLLLTSYFLLLTPYLLLDVKAKRARAGEVSRAHTPADEPDPTGPWGSSGRELQPAIRPWGCEHLWHPLGYI